VSPSVLVIEDDGDVVDLVRRSLERADIACIVAGTGADGVAAARRGHPDAILLDLDLPDVDGLELISSLRDVAPVIVLTGRSSEDTIVTSLERGAEDYVTKPFSTRVLVARIEVALRRSGREQGGVLERGPLTIDVERRQASIAGRPLDLTRRELDLLAHLAEHPGEVIARDDLLAAVWRSSTEWQTSATVTEHVRRIRVKLGDPRWIESVRGVGYRFTVPE
jgi:DNA-binding response OmpR family regulator